MGKVSTSWKPGQSGNPKGAPKKDWTWASELKKATEEAQNGVPIKEFMAKSMIKEVLKGNVNAFNAVANRMEGMPFQALKHEGGVKVEGVVIYKPEKAKK